MKKSLMWLLSGLAVAGLFSLAACDEDESTPVACSAENNPCAEQGTHCYVDAEGAPKCASWVCENGYNTDGTCIDSALGDVGATCSNGSECKEGLDCIDNACAYPATNKFRFVRIEDLSKACDKSNCGADPGADIDAVVLVKNGQAPIYATDVKGYSRSDGKSTIKDRTMAADATKAVGAPDSFVNYPTADQCNYFNATVSAGDNKESREYTFVSLGGVGGYLELQMGAEIEAGDKLDILELGKCKLYNTESKPMAYDTNAQAEQIQVQISVSGDANTWSTVNDGKKIADDTNHGILTVNITAADLK